MQNKLPVKYTSRNAVFVTAIVFLLTNIPLRAQVQLRAHEQQRVQEQQPDKNEKIKKKLDSLIMAGRYAHAEEVCRKLPKKRRFRHQLYLLDYYLDSGRTGHALSYTEHIAPSDDVRKAELNTRLGCIYFSIGDNTVARKYLEKGAPSSRRAAGFARLADRALESGESGRALKDYETAVMDYSFQLKTLFMKWTQADAKEMRRCVKQLRQLQGHRPKNDSQRLLEKTLKGAAEYCEKMKRSAFHFFCKEDIREMVDFNHTMGLVTSGKSYKAFTKNRYIYEYQLFREEGRVTESRTLLELNGIKKKVPDAQLKINGIRYKKLIFGPISLVSREAQPRYFYTITGEDQLWGEPAVVIEALPIYYGDSMRLYGKIWINNKDYSVMKIQFNPKSIQSSHLIEKRSMRHNARPKVDFYEEFQITKFGIRFPSRYYLEEAYLLKTMPKFVRLQLDAKFKDYMFFVVGSEVIEAKPEIKR